MTGEGEPQIRDGFSGKRGFILSSIGSAVGMANIWRFPAMVSLWGGLTFIIPYLIFVVLITSACARNAASGTGGSGSASA